MSELTVSVAQRVFRCNALEISDPNPTLDAKEAWKLIRDNYPHLKTAVLSEPTFEAGRMVVEVELPPVKTNG